MNQQIRDRVHDLEVEALALAALMRQDVRDAEGVLAAAQERCREAEELVEAITDMFNRVNSKD